MTKLNRTYELSVQLSDSNESAVIKPPFTIEVDITRNTMASANKANLKLYNLSATLRRRIFHDRYKPPTRVVTLKAGYEGSELSVIFTGQIMFASSQRRNTEWITEIECLDGALAYYSGVLNKTYEAGTDTKNIVIDLSKSLPGTKDPIVGSFSGTAPRGQVLMGSTTEILNEITQGNFYIDNGRPIALQKNEVLTGAVRLINSDTGLLNSPRRQNTVVEVDMVFEPRLSVGQVIELQSIETIYNGQYKINGIKHTGIISETHGGPMVTTASLWLGAQLNPIAGVV